MRERETESETERERMRETEREEDSNSNKDYINVARLDKKRWWKEVRKECVLTMRITVCTAP